MVAWSFSVLDSFETCAFRHWAVKVAKVVVEPQTEQMTHGNRVHKAIENRIGGTALPADMAHYEPMVSRVIKAAEGGKIVAEQKMALDPQFRPTTFFAKNVWVRAITDATVFKGTKALVIDWKTGNPKPESAQLRLTAACTFALNPTIQSIDNAFMWLKTGDVTREKFTRDDVPTIWQEFMPRVQRLEQAHATNKWPKKPSGLCRKWCPVPPHMCEHRST